MLELDTVHTAMRWLAWILWILTAAARLEVHSAFKFVQIVTRIYRLIFSDVLLADVSEKLGLVAHLHRLAIKNLCLQ